MNGSQKIVITPVGGKTATTQSGPRVVSGFIGTPKARKVPVKRSMDTNATANHGVKIMRILPQRESDASTFNKNLNGTIVAGLGTSVSTSITSPNSTPTIVAAKPSQSLRTISLTTNNLSRNLDSTNIPGNRSISHASTSTVNQIQSQTIRTVSQESNNLPLENPARQTAIGNGGQQSFFVDENALEKIIRDVVRKENASHQIKIEKLLEAQSEYEPLSMFVVKV